MLRLSAYGILPAVLAFAARGEQAWVKVVKEPMAQTEQHVHAVRPAVSDQDVGNPSRQ
jgi:hypothetical protein